MIKYIFYTMMVFSLLSCDTKPKLVTPDTTTGQETNPAAKPKMPSSANDSEAHQVVANEILQTDRYTYMNVTEQGRTFWIATARMEAEKGKKYMYLGGLMKLNFESQEFKRTFDTIYLVMEVFDSEQHAAGSMSPGRETAEPSPFVNNAPAPKVEGSIKLATLFKNMAKFKGKTVKVVGQVVKVNNGIMGRNWVHIREKGNDQDLTITTNEVVQVGENVAFEGKITLKKDFGSGYFYDLLMEEGKRLK